MFNSNRSIILNVYLCSMLSIFLFFYIHFQGRTPLHIASTSGYGEIVRLLLLFGADMDLVCTEVRRSTVFCFICVCYIFGKHAYFISMTMDKMTSMKIIKKI